MRSRLATLRLLVFAAGTTTMATEMSASRLLAPFFGTSTLVWANIIGLILIYLSVGYWYGGKLADRYPTMRALCTLTTIAAITIGVLPFVASPVLDLAVHGISDVRYGAMAGSFVGSLLLFSIPVTLLGMVPPFAIRLALRNVESSGEIAGSLYALSTIGSIVGTFGSVLLLIPWIGTRRTMLIFAVLLAVISLLGLPGRVPKLRVASVVLLMLVALALPTGIVRAADGGKVIFDDESRYGYIQVVQLPDGSRALQLNEGWAVHSIYNPHTPLTGNVWDHMLALPDLVRSGHPTGEHVLILGNAGGSFARLMRAFVPGVHLDGVELDPEVTKVARRYFGLNHDGEHVYSSDARPFLAASSKHWDLIEVDAYQQPYIPFYLATKEFFALTRTHLNRGGVFAVNVGRVPGDDVLVRWISATMHAAYPSVYRLPAGAFNDVLVATREPSTLPQLVDKLRHGALMHDTVTHSLIADAVAQLRPTGPDTSKVMTDDRAPIEWLTDSMIVWYALHGAADLAAH